MAYLHTLNHEGQHDHTEVEFGLALASQAFSRMDLDANSTWDLAAHNAAHKEVVAIAKILSIEECIAG